MSAVLHRAGVDAIVIFSTVQKERLMCVCLSLCVPVCVCVPECVCVCANGFGKSKARLVNGAAIEWQDRTGQDRQEPKRSQVWMGREVGLVWETGQQTETPHRSWEQTEKQLFVHCSHIALVVVFSLILNFMKIPATWRMRNIIWQPAKIRI